MVAIINWVTKFLSGFAIWKADKLGKILWVSVIVVAVIFCFWKLFLEKKVQNVTHYDNCTVTQNAPVECPKEPAFELIKLWRLRLFSVR